MTIDAVGLAECVSKISARVDPASNLGAVTMSIMIIQDLLIAAWGLFEW